MLSFISHKEGQTRLFDTLYDPLYIVSGPKDFLRANKFILNTVLPVHANVLIRNVFNSNENKSPLAKSPSLLPHFHRKLGEDFQECKSMNGKDLCGHYLPLFLYEAPHLRKTMNVKYDAKLFEKKVEDLTKTTSCQTDYRDSSAQTTPIQPEAVFRQRSPLETDEPEILLADKIFKGQTKPPGEYEARIMERVKLRRQWEKSLPTLLNPEEIEKRQAILEAFEWEEWIKREDYIVEVQNMRLRLVEKLLEERHKNINEKSELRMQLSLEHISQKRAKKQEKIKKDYLRAIRKINAKAQNSVLYKTPDIITQYADLTSERYLPQVRFGTHPKRRNFVGFRKRFSERIESINARLGEIDLTSLKCSIRRYEEFSQPRKPIKTYSKNLLSDKNLQTMYESLKKLRLQLSETRKSVHCIFEKDPEVEIPPTPKLCEHDPQEEVAYQFSVYLQKLIKGRSVQKVFNEIRRAQIHLIKEIRSVHKFSSVIPLFPEEYNEINRHRNVALRQHRRAAKMNQSKVDVTRLFRQREATELGAILDFLEKEYVRLNQEKEIHALYLLAEAERKKREAAEAGKRQREHIRRREHDHINADIVKTTRDTSIFYLENIFLEEMENCAKEKARDKIRDYAKYLDSKAEESNNNEADPHSHTSTSTVQPKDADEEFIDDVVNTFLFPEVHKRLAFREIAVRRKQHLNAAHKLLYNTFEDVLPDADEQKSNLRDDAYIKQLIKSVRIPDNVISALSCNEDIIRHEALSTIKELYIEISDDNIGKNVEELHEEEEMGDEFSHDHDHKLDETISARDNAKILSDEDRAKHKKDSLKKIVKDISEQIYFGDRNDPDFDRDHTMSMPDPKSVVIDENSIAKSNRDTTSSKVHQRGKSEISNITNAYFGNSTLMEDL